MDKRCPVCDSVLEVAYYPVGAGTVCPAKDCPVVDDANIWREEIVKAGKFLKTIPDPKPYFT